MSESKKSGAMVAVLIGAILALIVTGVRFYGELHLDEKTAEPWQKLLFSREAGGGGSPLSATILSVLWSFFVGRSLAKSGTRPSSTGRGLLLHLIGFMLLTGLIIATAKGGLDFVSDPHTRILTMNCTAAAIGLLALTAWPRSWLTMTMLGYLVHLPVLAVQYYAFANATETHYAKGPPFLAQQYWEFALTMAQLVTWPLAFTTLAGGFFAVLGAATVKK